MHPAPRPVSVLARPGRRPGPRPGPDGGSDSGRSPPRPARSGSRWGAVTTRAGSPSSTRSRLTYVCSAPRGFDGFFSSHNQSAKRSFSTTDPVRSSNAASRTRSFPESIAKSLPAMEMVSGPRILKSLSPEHASTFVVAPVIPFSTPPVVHAVRSMTHERRACAEARSAGKPSFGASRGQGVVRFITRYRHGAKSVLSEMMPSI